MEIFGVFSFWVSLFFIWFLCFDGLMAEEDERKTSPFYTSNRSPSAPPPPLRPLLLPPPPPHPQFQSPPRLETKSNVTTFRPSIAVIVAVLTTMFSITFLLLLYAKHCKRNNGHSRNPNSTRPISSTTRKNSGIDRSVIESLPLFRFASLRGQKDGLECSVCLNRFEPTEVLRLLPKCKHAFHFECVDTWLDAHSTCPLCRYRVDPEDVLLIEELKLEQHRRSQRSERSESVRVSTELENRKSDDLFETQFRRISGRHSSAGERTSQFLQISVQRPGESTHHDSCRRSLDSAAYSDAYSRKKNDESVTVGCFDRDRVGSRKDGLLLSETTKAAAIIEAEDRENFLRRFDHKIILSNEGGTHRRWSDLRPSDLLFLQSQMIISNSGRYSLSACRQKREERERVVVGAAELQHQRNYIDVNGGNVINSRSVSEITGLNRFAEVGPRS